MILTRCPIQGLAQDSNLFQSRTQSSLELTCDDEELVGRNRIGRHLVRPAPQPLDDVERQALRRRLNLADVARRVDVLEAVAIGFGLTL
jgi:hypothetical protein